MPVLDGLDVLVIGSGIAGLSTAIALDGRRLVAVISKQSGGGGSTELAQGGIAAALAPGDSGAAHAADTVAAAAGLGDPDVAEALTAEAAEAVDRLAHLGVHFDAGAPAQEGGHSFARVVHARGDATGAEITQALLAAAQSRDLPVLPGVFLVDLLTTPGGGRVTGALVWDSQSRSLRHLYARTVVLATGGYGQLWASTTSPSACSGDGLAAALRGGAQVADLEFVQFHPTGMMLGRDPRPLASEALRGAGARLRDSAGDYLHSANGPGGGDLAPRDVVSRSMARRMSVLGSDHCFLDTTMLGPEVLAEHFPTFLSACRAAGLSPEDEWVPVSPTAHYTMGGVLTDADGRTTLEGLMAVGEVGCSGLHGANRLASNSLLEGAVIGRRAARAILESEMAVAPRAAVDIDELLPSAGAAATTTAAVTTAAEAAAVGTSMRDRLRSAMDTLAGVGRDAAGLEELARYLAGAAVPQAHSAENGAATAVHGASTAVHGAGGGANGATTRVHGARGGANGGGAAVDGAGGGANGGGEHADGAWELSNMVLIASAVAGLATRRCESRGAHWRIDYPNAAPEWRVRQVLQLLPGGEMGVGDMKVDAARQAVGVPMAARV